MQAEIKPTLKHIKLNTRSTVTNKHSHHWITKGIKDKKERELNNPRGTPHPQKGQHVV